MTNYPEPLAKKAFFAVIKKTKHGVSRHAIKESETRTITSVATEKKYFGCIKRFLTWCKQNNYSTSKISTTSAQAYLEFRAVDCVQKTVDGYRQSIGLIFDLKLRYVTSIRPTVLMPRAYLRSQISYLEETATETLSFSICLAAAGGLRAIELDTIARASELSEDERDWLPDRFTGLDADSVKYVVIGKGGLKRAIMLPLIVSIELEKRRLPTPVRKKQREIFYTKHYAIVGGHNFSQQFSRLSMKEFNWSEGAHGLRHRFAQDRIAFLQRMGFTYDYAEQIVSQEMGHFSSANTRAYLR